jgi:hypothetical protein
VSDLISYLATFAKLETIQEMDNRKAGIGQPSHFWKKGAYLHALGAAILAGQGVMYFTPDGATEEGKKYLTEHYDEIHC